MREPRSDFQEFEASELFCPRCKGPKPVRKHLLLVLPTGEKFDYRCAECGASVGSKMTDDGTGFSLLKPT